MGLIVTFYSYKGGVGRSMALANVAVLLSKWGYKTLVVDWDLEAPGLESFFRDYYHLEELEEQKGVVELLCSARERTRDEGEDDGGDPPQWQMGWRDYLVSVGPQKESVLHLLTAGRRGKEDKDYKEYFSKVRSFDMEEFYEQEQGGFFIEQLRDEWRKEYDFVLVDSRTGITDIGGICTIQLPDILVLLFTATHEGLRGAVRVARRATEARGELPFDRFKLLTIPVPSRFDRSVEFKLADEWMQRFEKGVRDLYDDWLPKNVSRGDILELTKIPYQAFFSFGEKLAVVEAGKTLDPSGIGHAYETLTALIAHRLENAHRLRENRDDFVKLAAAGAKAKPVPEVDAERLAEERKRHEEWLASGGSRGGAANLGGRRLRGASLRSARLDQASFAGADLSTADLSDASLSGANFSEVNLQGASLERADASRANFQKATLIDANLQGANLRCAGLGGTNLQGANAAGADLRQADLRGANLSRTELRNARLRDADLEKVNAGDAQGLTASQLGGVNLAGAKVPERLLQPEKLYAIRPLVMEVQLFLAVLVLTCAYSAYMVLGETANVLLITNSPIPGLGLGLRLNSFYLAAPFVLLALYFILHYFLQRLWETLADLPAVFPDGTPLDERISNWFVTPMLRAHFRRLRAKPPSAVLRLLFTFLSWWLVPIVVALIWLRYLPMSNWFATGTHVVWVALATGAGLYLYELAVRTLRGERLTPPGRGDAGPADDDGGIVIDSD